ncbi:MAG TPA: insulinase family protein, partial [Gemmatimonadales bacterium]|nr:insulinase family protein [Gemmatimonadales bacterium]
MKAPHQVVTRTREIRHGEPVFAGTRIPVRSLVEHLDRGKGLDEFLDANPDVPRELAEQTLALGLEALLKSIPLEPGPSQRSLLPRLDGGGVILNAEELSVALVTGKRVRCPGCRMLVFRSWPEGWDGHAATRCRGLGGTSREARKSEFKRRFSHLFLALALALALAPAAGLAQTDSLLPVDSAVKVGTLPNGLRYYVRVNRRPERRAELRLVVNAGSVLEDADQRGLAHFVEHMAFNGTRNFEKQKLVDYIESIGMRFGPDLNAYTSFDETVYQLQVPTDSGPILRQAFQILEDWAHGVSLDTAEIRKERGVVLEEWRLGRGAGQRMLDQQLPVLFRGSRYADRLPIGTLECIRQCPAEAIRRFYETWYRPELMAVVAVGDFDLAAVEALIRERFAGVGSGATRPRDPARLPPRAGPEVSVASDPEATGTAVSVYLVREPRPRGTVSGWRAGLVERLAAGILNERLWELSQRPNPPFLRAGVGPTELARTAEAFTFGAVVADTGVQRGLEAILTELERAGRHGFTTAELDRARRDYLRGLEQAFAERDKTESIQFAEEYAGHFLTGEPIPGIGHEYQRAGAVLPVLTLADLNRVARGWLAGGGGG